MMTQYSIALHVLGKNLLILEYYKEAKHFITKAHYVVTKMLVASKKVDLQFAIQVDMKTCLEKIRNAAVANIDKALEERKKSKDEKVLTDEDIERSLAAIKSGLAAYSENTDLVQERFEAID